MRWLWTSWLWWHTVQLLPGLAILVLSFLSDDLWKRIRHRRSSI